MLLLFCGKNASGNLWHNFNFTKTKKYKYIFQLRYLQTLNSISAENNSTVIFPVPIDIINSFMTPPANNNMPPFQHYNLLQPQQQFHKAHMMNVKQRPPLVPTHSKVSKVSKGRGARQSVNIRKMILLF